MNSSWQNPLPSEEYITRQVAIYFYTGRWVPIMLYSFAAAIELSHRAQQLGQDLYIFPSNTLPNEFERLHQCSRHPVRKEYELVHPKLTQYAKAS